MNEDFETEIINALRNGDFQYYERLCGYPYTITGKVVHGKGLGRTVGMPTANIDVTEDMILPNYGVYATIVKIKDKRYRGLTNIGTRPSVDNDDKITIETYIIDFSQDIYDEIITLEIRFRIRDIIQFPNLDMVREQIRKDMEFAEKMLL